MLIDHGASVDVENDMTSTALHEAAENGHDKIVEILLKHTSNINIQNHIGYTPLTHASEGGHIKIVNALLDRGALTDLKTIYTHSEDTALTKAARNGHDAVS